jgi:hypothetical protein
MNKQRKQSMREVRDAAYSPTYERARDKQPGGATPQDKPTFYRGARVKLK